MASLVLNRQECSATHCVEQTLTVNENVIEIYDNIVPWKYDDTDAAVTVQDVTNMLNEIDGDVTVRINCRGGEVGTALTIYNGLKQFKGNVTTVVDGYAFSCAGWIAQAGDVRNIATGGIFMIHNPQMEPVIKNLSDIENVKNQWLTHQSSILDIFEERTKMGRDAIKNLMEKESFLSATDAVTAGFFDSVETHTAELSALNYVAPKSLPKALYDAPEASDKVTAEDVANLHAQRNRLFRQKRDLLVG